MVLYRLQFKSVFLSQHAIFTCTIKFESVISNILAVCKRNIDAVFMLDRSGSVGLRNHMVALQFINTVISFFNIGHDASRIGLVAYSTIASIEFDLDDHTTLSNLQGAVNNVMYYGGSTNSGDAIEKARLLLNPMNNRGARLSSEGIPKIAILITGDKIE